MTCFDRSEELCKACGLCCQGIFHSYAHIYNEKDREFANEIQAEIFYSDDEKTDVFSLSCPAFDKICTVYPLRPSVCQGHECDLLKSFKSQKITFNQAMDTIDKIKNVLQLLLPELKQISGDSSSNNPVALREKIIESFPDKTMSDAFKNNHKKMLMNYSLFIFLKDTRFYISSGDEADKNLPLSIG